MIERYLSVIGDPIEHSLSPLIHRNAYQQLGLFWQYDKNLVRSGEVADFLKEMPKYTALSVTMPLKEEAFAYCEIASQEAELTHAVNTLFVAEGIWHGANTDIFGLKSALSGIQTKEIETVSILGSGASSRSALVASTALFPSAEISIFARNPDHFAMPTSAFDKVQAVSLAEFTNAGDLVINTTPVDFAGRGVGSKYWMNLNYSNHLLAPRDSVTIDGLEMLIWQAVAQIRLFTKGELHAELADEDEVVLKIRDALQLSRMGE